MDVREGVHPEEHCGGAHRGLGVHGEVDRRVMDEPGAGALASEVENGDLDSAKVGTIRNYLQAVGGDMSIEYVLGDQRVQVA